MSHLSRRERRDRMESRSYNRRLLLTGIVACAIAAAGLITPVVYQELKSRSTDLAVVSDWGNSNNGCGIQSLAMISPLPDDGERLQVSDSSSLAAIQSSVRAEFWESGFLQLNLSAADSASFTVLSLDIIDREELEESPQWLYMRDYGGCGGIGDTSVFLTAHIDTPSVRPAENDTNAMAFQGGAFQPFSVTKDAAATFKIKTEACQSNWKFFMQLKYQKAGQSEVSYQTFGPFTVYGTNQDAPVRLGSLDGQLRSSTLDDPAVNMWRYTQCNSRV